MSRFRSRALILVLFILTGGFTARGTEVGFGTRDFRAVIRTGKISIVCHESNENLEFTCRTEDLMPSSFGYFYGPEGVRGDMIGIKASLQGSTTRTKVEDYDANQHRSKNLINLWSPSIIDTPLLRLGSNTIEYVIYEQSTLKAKSQFKVEVRQGPPQTCSPLSLLVQKKSDCYAVFTLCQKYFEQNPHCK